MRAIPAVITEFDTVNESETVVSVDAFNNLFRMFWNDPDYTVNRYPVPDGHVYAVFYVGNGNNSLSSYAWHVPSEF